MSVEILVSATIFHHIVITPSSSQTTYVISINSTTKRPFYTGIPNVDMFPDHKLAVQQIVEKYKPIARYTGENIFGVAKDGSNTLVIGLIDNSEATGWTPGGHLIKTVRHVNFVTIPSKTDNVFAQYQLENNHYYCEDYDLTRLFPSSHPADDPDTDFSFNTEWIKPFKDLGIAHCCVQLIQGVCMSSSLPGRDFTLTYILRRSCLNPGTRYLARGLNKQNEPGNEVECELIFSRQDQFWTHRWRRGSVPIKWKTNLASSLGKPVHTPDEDFFDGCPDYFRKLILRFGDDIPIRCLSLLENEENKSEFEVYEAYKKAIELLPEKEMITNVSFIQFNVNHLLSKIGALQTKDQFAEVVKPLIDNDGFTVGKLPDVIEQTQKGIMRFNCADSLDRVNLVTFFYSLIVAEKWTEGPLSQDIIDFIAKAFVTSGHIISQLYTNTQAIKTEHIKKFSPNVNVELSDSAVTLQRRLQNVAFDPARNKVISDFVFPNNITRKIVVDPEHIFEFPSNFPRELFELPNLDVVLNESIDVTIALPRPMIFSSFSIRHCTASDLLVMCGSSLSDLSVCGNFKVPRTFKRCRFNMSDTDRFGIDNFKQQVSNFVVIRLIATAGASSFVCGNIRLECELPDADGQTASIWSPVADDEQSLERFKSCFDDFLKSDRKLKDAFELERMRLGLNISEDVRIDLAVKNGINPFMCDSNSLMYVASKEGCALCGRLDVEQKEFFVRCPDFRGLIKEYEGGDEYLGCCAECVENANNIAILANLYTSEYIKPMKVPKFSFIRELPMKSDNNNRLAEIAFPSSVRFTSSAEENDLLNENNENLIKVDGKRSFSAFFFQNSIISTVILTLDSTEEEKNEEFKFIYDGKEMELSKLENGNQYSLFFEEPPITHFLNFEIVGNISLKKFQCMGVSVIATDDQPIEKAKKMKMIPEIKAYGYEWHEAERTAVYKFDGKKKISEIGVDVMKSENIFTIAQSLIFVFFEDSTIVGSNHLILPRVKDGASLWYTVETEQFNRIEVYYIDRELSVRPHTIGFTFE